MTTALWLIGMAVSFGLGMWVAISFMRDEQEEIPEGVIYIDGRGHDAGTPIYDALVSRKPNKGIPTPVYDYLTKNGLV